MIGLKRKFPRKLFRQVSAAESIALMTVGVREGSAGDIDFDGTVVIAGRVEGDIRARRIVINKGAVVDGAAMARAVHINGSINGEIDAGLVSLGPNAVIKGNIHYDALKISTGASVWGLCRDRRRMDQSTPNTAHVDCVRPLPFSLLRSLRRRPKMVLEFPPGPKLRPAVRSMRAVWEGYLQSDRSNGS